MSSHSVSCDPGYGSGPDTKVKIGYVVRATPCYEEYVGPEVSVSDLTLVKI